MAMTRSRSSEDVLCSALNKSHVLIACKSREDIEILGNGKISDKHWDIIASGAEKKGVSVGRHLKQLNEEAQKIQIQSRVDALFRPILYDVEGRRRPPEEISKRLDALFEVEKEKVEAAEFDRAKALLDGWRKRNDKKPDEAEEPASEQGHEASPRRVRTKPLRHERRARRGSN